MCFRVEHSCSSDAFTGKKKNTGSVSLLPEPVKFTFNKRDPIQQGQNSPFRY